LTFFLNNLLLLVDILDDDIGLDEEVKRPLDQDFVNDPLNQVNLRVFLFFFLHFNSPFFFLPYNFLIKKKACTFTILQTRSK